MCGLMYAKAKRAYCVWFNGCEGKTTTELTVCGSMYVKEKQQTLQCMVQRMHRGKKNLLCMVQCMRRKQHRAYSVWFDVCEGKTTTELTVYGSMYAKEKTQSLQCMVRCM